MKDPLPLSTFQVLKKNDNKKNQVYFATSKSGWERKSASSRGGSLCRILNFSKYLFERQNDGEQTQSGRTDRFATCCVTLQMGETERIRSGRSQDPRTPSSAPSSMAFPGTLAESMIQKNNRCLNPIWVQTSRVVT